MKIFRLAGLGAVVGFCAMPCAHADATADKIADVNTKIDALEKIVTQDQETAAEAAPSFSAPMAPAAPPATNTVTVTPVPTNPGNTNTAPVVTTTTVTRVRNPMARAMSYFFTLRSNVQRQDYFNAINAANNLTGADPNPEIKTAVTALLPELQQLRDARQAVVDAQLKQLGDQVTQAIFAAKEAKDLDAVVVGVDNSSAQARTQLRGQDSMAAYQKIEEISRYLKQWQRYLSDLGAGNAQQAQMDVRMLSDMPSTYAPIPRSQLLSMEQGDAANNVEPIDVKIELHSLDDIPAAISKLQDAEPQPQQPMINGQPGLVQNFVGIAGPGQFGGNPALNVLIGALESLQNAGTALSQKDYSAALAALQFPFFSHIGIVSLAGTDKVAAGAVRKQVLDLKESVLIKIAQGILALPQAPAPPAGQHAVDYLGKVAEAKAKAGDWAGLQQVLTVLAQVAGPDDVPPSLLEDTAALRAYLIGEKLETAGQTLDAIRSYRQSLATLGKYFPADPPAAKLKELAAKFPDVYQQALQQPIAKTP